MRVLHQCQMVSSFQFIISHQSTRSKASIAADPSPIVAESKTCTSTAVSSHSGSRVDPSPLLNEGPKPKVQPHLSNKQRKELKKRERKEVRNATRREPAPVVEVNLIEDKLGALAI